ncbi:MAG: hypothetical protein BWK74_05150 [Desulfobacteraceae bacterium A6]|nr:MAG: hypothetical protein BWK74_05150 [Desulfobacteraceae bacterium A6]
MGKRAGAAGNRSAPRSILRRGQCDIQGESISGLLIDIPYPDQILDFVFTRNYFGKPGFVFFPTAWFPSDAAMCYTCISWPNPLSDIASPSVSSVTSIGDHIKPDRSCAINPDSLRASDTFPNIL